MSQSDQAFIRAYREPPASRRSEMGLGHAPATAHHLETPMPQQYPTAQAQAMNHSFAGTIDVSTVSIPLPAALPARGPISGPHARFAKPPVVDMTPAGERQTFSRTESISHQAAQRPKQWMLHESHPRPELFQAPATPNYQVPMAAAPNYAEPTTAFTPQPSFPHYEPQTYEPQAAVAGRIAPANKPLPTQAAPTRTASQIPYSPLPVEEQRVVERLTPHAEHQSEFRPGLEVEQFAWMPLIDNLCQQQQIGFDRVLLELEAELSADRRIIALTSVKRGEGRTTMLQCLARRAAEMGLRVCLLDLDDSKPALAEQLGLAIDSGWEQAVFAGKPLAECCVEANRDALTAVLLKQALQPGALAQQSIAASAMLLELREQFDLILVDTAPLCVDSAASEGRSTYSELPIDRWLVVRDLRHTSLAELARWQRQLGNRRMPFLGVLENRADQEALSGSHQG
jgi:Mrp family chromosome partitioning ATPase